jgi:deoxyhypusine synthase
MKRFEYARSNRPDIKRPRHEPAYWGGLSGCTYSEGVSWGKFIPPAEGGQFAEVRADATLVLPLLAKALFETLDS